jgi:hypothetical protein
MVSFQSDTYVKNQAFKSVGKDDEMKGHRDAKFLTEIVFKN